MELQKVAFKADDDDGPVRQSLNTFTAQFGAVVDKQLKVFLHTYKWYDVLVFNLCLKTEHSLLPEIIKEELVKKRN